MTIAGALSLILGAGLGVPCAIGIHHLAVTGEVWTQFGFPACGRGPFERAGIRTSIPPGTRFRGRSRPGWLRWNRTCEILAVDPPRQIAWRTIPTPLFVAGTHWRITLEPAGTGTRIVQTFQITKRPRCREWIVAPGQSPAHRPQRRAHRGPAPDRALAAGARATKAAGDADHRGDDSAAAGTLDQRGRLR